VTLSRAPCQLRYQASQASIPAAPIRKELANSIYLSTPWLNCPLPCFSVYRSFGKTSERRGRGQQVLLREVAKWICLTDLGIATAEPDLAQYGHKR
jgi:hypothetical protein